MAGGAGAAGGMGGPMAANNTMSTFGSTTQSPLAQLGTSSGKVGLSPTSQTASMGELSPSNPTAGNPGFIGPGTQSGAGGTFSQAMSQMGMAGMNKPSANPTMSQSASQQLQSQLNSMVPQLEQMSPAQRQQFASQFQAQELAAEPWRAYGTQLQQQMPNALQGNNQGLMAGQQFGPPPQQNMFGNPRMSPAMMQLMARRRWR